MHGNYEHIETPWRNLGRLAHPSLRTSALKWPMEGCTLHNAQWNDFLSEKIYARNSRLVALKQFVCPQCYVLLIC